MSDTAGDEPTRWRDRAVSRTVEPARATAETRVQAFIDAGLAVLADPDAELTVQNVVDRSGLSLRSFYQQFAGKYELLLAVFEEAIRITASQLQHEVDAAKTPLARLEAFITEYYRMCRSQQPRNTGRRLPARSMGTFTHQLLFDHPQEAAHAFGPLVTLLRRLLDDVAESGDIQQGLDHEQVAGIILQSIMFNAFATTVTGAPTDEAPGRGELFWRVLLHGLAGQG